MRSKRVDRLHRLFRERDAFWVNRFADAVGKVHPAFEKLRALPAAFRVVVDFDLQTGGGIAFVSANRFGGYNSGLLIEGKWSLDLGI